MHTIFYSWQSDLAKKCNKNFIEQTLQQATDRVKKDETFKVEPSIDKDTQGLPGMPSVAQSIFEKIKKSNIFIGDVSIITPLRQRKNRRPIPNPNVLIELGYAASVIGWEKIICVMNTAYGKPENLPFDLLHRRWPIQYEYSESFTDVEKIKTIKAELIRDLEHAIKTIVNSGILYAHINPKDKRLAVKFRKALDRFLVHAVTMPLQAKSQKRLIGLFGENYEDEQGMFYPPAKLIAPIMAVMNQIDLRDTSNLTNKNRPLLWFEAFDMVLGELIQECDGLLDRFSERDDSLTMMIDDVQARADSLRKNMQTYYSGPSSGKRFSGPSFYLGNLQVLLLSILKSLRIIRLFTKV